MKKQSLLFLLVAAILTNSNAQNEGVSTTSVGFKARVGSGLEYLGEDKVYKILLPDEPTLAKGKLKKFSLFSSGFGLDAKRAKGDDAFYKSFRIISSGVKSIIREEDEKVTTLAGSGFVKRLYFNFPISIEVANPSGQVEKTFVVVSETQEISEVFHSNTMLEGSIVQKTPFATQEIMNRQYSENREALVAKIERDAIQNTLYPKVKSVINAAYGSNKYSGGFLYIYTPSKSYTGEPADLGTQCSELKNALSELNDKEKEVTALQKIETAYGYFDKALNTGSTNSGMAQLYLGNKALAALVTGHLEEAEESFSKFYLQFGQPSKNKASEFGDYFELLYNVYGYYHTIRQSTLPVVYFNLRPRGFDEKENAAQKLALQKKMDAAAQKQASRLPVFNGEEGYAMCVDKDKKEVTIAGGIFYDFNAAKVEYKGVTKSAPLKIKGKDGELEEIQMWNILYFVVGEKKYQSTIIKGDEFLKVASLATGNLDITEFWEVLQEDPDRAIYLQRVGADEFAITRSVYLEAVSVSDIIKKRKPAKEFLEKCPALAQAIENKQVTMVKTREDFKKFYKWIQDNCE